MKNKLGLIMIVAIIATAFACGSKSATQEESASTSTTDTTKVQSDTTKTPQDTTKTK